MFISSQVDLEPSLAQEAVIHSSTIPPDCGLSQSSKDTLGTSLSKQGARNMPLSIQKSIVTAPLLAQNVLEIQASLECPLGSSQYCLRDN